MAPKRIHPKKKKQRFKKKALPNTPGVDASHNVLTPLLAILAKNPDPLSLSELEEYFNGRKITRKDLHKALSTLIDENFVVPAGKKRFRLNWKNNLFTGIIEKNPRGFGFVINLKPVEAAVAFHKDPFLTVRDIGTANHGDSVLIKVKKVRKDGRPEAVLLAILQRFSEKITGFFKQGNPAKIVPEDLRYPSNITLAGAIPEGIEENDVVIVDILPGPSLTGFVQGTIIEVLGSPQNIDVQMRMVIEKHDLPHIFPDDVLQEAATLQLDNSLDKDRLDLRDTCHVTIDGETAKDFDDAIAVAKTENGFRLYVSIADVSHFVKAGSRLDQEAYNRGTSIYFPGRVIPMLPERLSNHLCSLVPGEDRLTFSAILDFDNNGVLLKKKFSKSIICSKHRFTYTTVKEILIDNNAKVRKQHEQFLNALQSAQDLAVLLHDARMRRGSIGFNIPEPEVALEKNGRIKSITRKERNFAHQIIEEFMLAANEAVAETFTRHTRDFIYRIHEKPAPEKVEEFASFAATLGLELPPISGEPSWFAAVLELVRNTPAEYVVNNLLLRSMQQARYSSHNQGHFGLAATDYTHFTSPIRRYPDLMVHRFLHSFLSRQHQQVGKDAVSLEEQAKHVSARERLAITAERDINDRLKIFFMEQFIGENFKAVISGVSENVLFIELLDLFVSGSVDIATLTDDYYLYDGKRHRLIGEISAKTYQLGAAIEVTLLDVDHSRRRINFAPVAKNSSAQ
ncbi:MAG: ribonuclease R [Desulfopila sp.]|jgi:ribonuclease R|nr:ribonuclease R [Desulfopila sp.]